MYVDEQKFQRFCYLISHHSFLVNDFNQLKNKIMV